MTVQVPTFLVTGMVLIGTGLLCASLLPFLNIIQIVGSRQLRSGWAVLLFLDVMFIIGYASFVWIRYQALSTYTELIVALILFLGAIFVVSVAFLSQRTARDIQLIAMLKRDAFIDPLTDLYNRRYLEPRLAGEIARTHRSDGNLSAVMIDIDHFKRVNDSHGHETGDKVLRGVCAVIKDGARPTDIVVRYGGEEIVLIAPDTGVDGAFALADRLRESIIAGGFVSAEGTPIQVTASFGISSLLASDDAGTFIARADQALYEAKSKGRNLVITASSPRSGVDDVLATAESGSR